ncbi:Cytosine deaminase [Vermiconidia calcicola]|uniref:Cytosine deaminase n=1 Tax=Vermiconidia calcicola TaxID=1690605 RepID=A0ACC3NVE9_9PEZI|nr:Cytosine deaminase [Vermiconidia calcicola]
MSTHDKGYQIALEEGKKGLAEGGIPVGACIVGSDGKILGRGRNTEIQNGSRIVHGETAAFDSDHSVPQSAYQGATLYTTMSCCPMCTGAAIWFGVKRVVVGDRVNYRGPQETLEQAGIEVIVLDTEECIDLTKQLIEKSPEKWYGLIGDK